MKTIRIILLVLIIIGIGLLFTQKFWVDPLVNYILANTEKSRIQGEPLDKLALQPDTYEWCMVNGGVDLTALPNSPKKCILNNKIYEENCVSNDKYFVISKGLTDSVGTNILIKYKSSPNQVISCDYVKTSGDYEIDGSGGEYVLALVNNLLIVDVGTAPPPRGLWIYNLDNRKEVFNDSYYGVESIKNDQIEYWSPTDIKPTTANCPEYNEWFSNHLDASIESRVILDLSTLTKKDTGEYRCDPLQ